LYERLKILGLLRLDGSDDNVFTSLLAAPGFIKHAIRLACTGCVTKKISSGAPQRCSLPLALAGGVVLD